MRDDNFNMYPGVKLEFAKVVLYVVGTMAVYGTTWSMLLIVICITEIPTRYTATQVTPSGAAGSFACCDTDVRADPIPNQALLLSWIAVRV